MGQASPVVIGAAIRIKGKVKGAEDLVVKGQIEGTVSLPTNHLAIEPAALMAGDVDAENITVRGEHAGNSVAADKVEMDATARVLGNLQTPRLIVADGAKFRGHVEMKVDLPANLNLKFKQ